MVKKILIVDDINFIIKFEESILKVLSQELSIEILVDSASSVKQALEKVATDSYDAIILDINLPDGSGIDIAKATQKMNTDTRIAGLSIYPHSPTEHDSYFDAFYKKPISPKTYKENIRILLDI
jgi:two-component system response regulator AtoC